MLYSCYSHLVVGLALSKLVLDNEPLLHGGGRSLLTLGARLVHLNFDGSALVLGQFGGVGSFDRGSSGSLGSSPGADRGLSILSGSRGRLEGLDLLEVQVLDQVARHSGGRKGASKNGAL